MVYLSDVVHLQVGQLLQCTYVPDVDLTGQTIVITGANTGLGFEAAKHFSRLKTTRLILACRDLKKGEAAKQKIMASSPSSPSSKMTIIEVWSLDMADISSILAFGERLHTLDRLDAFIANAGIDIDVFKRVEGYESVTFVNVIATLLVGLLALPVLRRTNTSLGKDVRLTFVCSGIHIIAKDAYLAGAKKGRIIESLNDEAKADMADRYALSKLMEMLVVRQLALHVDASISEKERKGPRVIVNYTSPGWCKTDLFRDSDGGIGKRIGLALTGRTAEQGCRTTVHAAVAERSTHGRYLSECQVKNESVWMRSPEGHRTGEDLWLELVEILEGVKVGVSKL